MKSKISHIEMNVLNYKEAIQFYDKIFPFMGIRRIHCMKDWAAYTDGLSKIILGPTEKEYQSEGFHRKRAGLNHLAFYAESKEEVDQFYNEVMIPNQIEALYEGKPYGDESYYAVFFEGPDRLKLEFVYSPNYCEKSFWPSEDDFDPYSD